MERAKEAFLMSRIFLYGLLAAALVSLASRHVLADEADPGDGKTVETAAPSEDKAGDKKESASSNEAKPPQSSEVKKATESKGTAESADKKGADVKAAETKPDSTIPDETADNKNKDDAPKKSEPADSKEKKPDTASQPSKETQPEENKTTATDEKLEPWQQLYQQWLGVDEQLKALQLKYFHAPKDEQFEIRESFQQMIEDEANPLLAKLRTEVIKAYKAKPNEDARVVKLLIGFMVNHARMGDEADAKEIIELLIENKADKKYVMVAAKAPGLRPTSLEILDRMVNRYSEAMSPEEGDSTPNSGGSFSPDKENPSGPEKAGSEDGAASEESGQTEKAGDPEK